MSGYFKDGNFLFKSLRFLNLMEPDKAVLSLSKILVIIMMWMFVYITINTPEQIVAVMTAGLGTIVSLSNYGYRRHMQHKDKVLTMSAKACPEEPEPEVTEDEPPVT